MAGDGLADKITVLHEALTAAGLPHAFGGALALAYCTAEPRATQDIDVNVFIGTERTAELSSALPNAIRVGSAEVNLLTSDGQARLWWGETAVDVFLSNHPFHDQAAANIRRVPFPPGLTDLPVLACADLAVFKAFYARPKDAVDVATMVAAGAVELGAVEATVDALLGSTEERAGFFARVEEFVSET